MTKVKSIALGTAAVMLASSVAIPAQATTALYSGGSTLAEKVYRDIMNCYGNQAGGDTVVGMTNPPAICNTASSYNANVEPLYIGVGSGNGRATLTSHDTTQIIAGGKKGDVPPVASTRDFGPYYGTGTGAGWVPASDATNKFPTIHFIGSDDPLAASEVTTYNTNGNSAGHNNWGAAVQFPGLIATVSIPFSPATGVWNPKGKKPTGGGNSSLVDLSTNTLCGIFTGQITTWDDAHITADNGKQKLGTGPISVIYRSDGSGTTYITSNALMAQCASTDFPVPASWQTASGGGKTNAAGVPNDNWYPTIAAAGLLPANFSGQSGSKAVRDTIKATAGSIGYVSPDFSQPVDPNGNATANLQTWASWNAGTTPVFRAPTGKNGTPIVGAVKPPSFAKLSCSGAGTGVAPFIQSADGICADNPLNWGVVFPKPVSAAAYPIGGFTFIAMYTCYAQAADVSALVGTTAGSLGYLRWYFGSATDNGGLVKASITANGFSQAPGSWITGVKKLLTTNKPTKVSTPGTKNTGCATVTGTGA